MLRPSVSALVLTTFAVFTAGAAIAATGVQDPTGADGLGDGLGEDPTGGLGNIEVGDLDPIVIGAVGLVVVTGLAFLAFSLGTKFVTSENVLDNDQRRAIYEFLRDNPGTHLRETANRLELSTTNVLWHLRKLEHVNLVNSKKIEGYKVYYPTEGGVETRRLSLAMSVVKNPNARQILEYISGHPGTHQREMARALGVNHGTVRWHLRKLNNVGLVLPVSQNHVTQYFLSELGTKILLTLAARDVAEKGGEPQAAASGPSPAAPAGEASRSGAAAVASGGPDDEFEDRGGVP